jgi:hypothetical protein
MAGERSYETIMLAGEKFPRDAAELLTKCGYQPTDTPRLWHNSNGIAVTINMIWSEQLKKYMIIPSQ